MSIIIFQLYYIIKNNLIENKENNLGFGNLINEILVTKEKPETNWYRDFNILFSLDSFYCSRQYIQDRIAKRRKMSRSMSTFGSEQRCMIYSVTYCNALGYLKIPIFDTKM